MRTTYTWNRVKGKQEEAKWGAQASNPPYQLPDPDAKKTQGNQLDSNLELG
jgi:hypothetical protein